MVCFHQQDKAVDSEDRSPTLLCPVRNCRITLLRGERRWFCAAGHSFDIARSGYVNLLQPQERRSKRPGDTPRALAGRRRLHELGVTGSLLRAISNFVSASSGDIALEAGCGDGFYLGNLARLTDASGNGIDISVPAIDAAARRYPCCRWVVANADRSLPYGDRSFTLVLSINGRMNPSEFRRVLRADGRLLIAVPSPCDLIELRGRGRDRVGSTVEAVARHFVLSVHRQVRTSAYLDAGSIRDALNAIYRPIQSRPPEAMRVTFSLDLLIFKPS